MHMPREGQSPNSAGPRHQQAPQPVPQPQPRHRVAQSAVHVGPFASVSRARALLEGLQWEHLAVQPLGATLGAEVRGIDLAAPLRAPVVRELRAALLAFKVIFFRDQPLTRHQHVALAAVFGEPSIHPLITPDPVHPLVERHERGTASSGTENAWHSDISWHPTPAMASLLRAVSVPRSGGDTLFADMAAVHDDLPAELQNRLATMTATHDFGRVVAHQRTPDELADLRRRHPASHHPVICTHPETGRRVLFVNPYFTEAIDGLASSESNALLAELCARIDRPAYQCRFQWQEHSIALWDNRSVQHYACSDYWPAPRIMERTLVTGGRPV